MTLRSLWLVMLGAVYATGSMGWEYWWLTVSCLWIAWHLGRRAWLGRGA